MYVSFSLNTCYSRQRLSIVRCLARRELPKDREQVTNSLLNFNNIPCFVA
jgi:hypothetical protein